MTGIQEKFFRQLDQAVRELEDVELVTKGAWANTGMGMVQQTTGFEVISQFDYNFQDGYATFTVNGQYFYATYVKEGDRSTLGDVIAAILRPVQAAK